MVEAMLKSFFTVILLNFLVGVIICLLDNGYYGDDALIDKIIQQLFKMNMVIAIISLGVLLAADVSIKTVIEVAK